MSKKFLIATANFDNWKQEFFIKNMSPRNKEYAKIHNFKYLEFLNINEKYRDHPTWLKFKIIKNLLEEKTLQDGDYVTQVDADMCIVKKDHEYLTKKSFSYAIDSANSHCMGNFSLKINSWTRNLVDLILDDERYEKLKNHITEHEYFGFKNSFVKDFREQASWYYLAGIKRHSQKSFWNYPNFGWHSNVTEFTEYNLDELYEHVEILPTEWNVTEVRGESECKFLINKSNYQDTIIRHFAGGQPWRKEWFDEGGPKRLKILDPYLYLKSFLPRLKPKTLKKIKKFIKKYVFMKNID